MSDSEEENFCFYGRPLEPYDEDAFPKKKPISVEEQIATDAQGRRRFHGAFTGGFSAGFFNTVGSLEGWTPSEFKSTRQDKAATRTQKPEDFMDDEDVSEFGIAPQTVRATSDFSTSKKRKKKVFSDGPIPGEPVLHSLLTSGNETIGYLLLRNIGHKDKDEIGEVSQEKVYGCEMPKSYEISREDDVYQYAIADIYKEFLGKPKDNTFGLGYEGLDKEHINLFQSTKLVIREKNNKKVSITGQAFGVGAFEEEDDDIYVKEDMSKYDFELTSEKKSKKDTVKKKDTIFDDFIASKETLPPKEIFLPPTIPHSFTGKHKIKRSRFEPLPQGEKPERKEMNPEIRARYLGEEHTPNTTPVTKTNDKPVPMQDVKKPLQTSTDETESSSKNSFLNSALMLDRFVSASKSEDPSNILEPVAPTETSHGTEEMRGAAKMKMFGPLTRIISDWPPCSILCRRFNVPEPQSNELDASKNRKRTKNLIFEYEKFADVTMNDLKPGLSMKESSDNVINDTIGELPGEAVKIEGNTELDINKENGQHKENDSLTKDITERIDVDKNIDLFKAVFLSSSESEDEEDSGRKNEVANKTSEIKNSVLSDTLLTKIKPIKEGILSNMDFSIFSRAPEANKRESIEVKSVEEDSNVEKDKELSYGPALPMRVEGKNEDITTNISKITKESDSDEWIEKDEIYKKNKSHKKKHKNKHKNKKKHKHGKK